MPRPDTRRMIVPAARLTSRAKLMVGVLILVAGPATALAGGM